MDVQEGLLDDLGLGALTCVCPKERVMLSAEVFMMIHPAGRAFKALRYVVRGAKYYKNARNVNAAFNLVDASQTKETFGESMLRASNGFTGSIYKGVKETVTGAVQDLVLEMIPEVVVGSLAVVEASFGLEASEPPEYQLGESAGYQPTEVVYYALSSKKRRHLRRNDADAPSELMVNVDFGISDAGAHSAILSSLVNGGLFTMSNGFDVNEFGLFDESTAIIQECTYLRNDDGTDGELQECKEIFRGAHMELNVRMVILKSQFSYNSQKDGLIAAVRAACSYNITSCSVEELDLVKIVKEIDVECPGSGEECVQVDMSIGATTTEMKQEFFGRLSLQAVNGILFHHHNSLESTFCNFYQGGANGNDDTGQRRDSDVATKLVSFGTCPSKCGACPEGMYGEEVDIGAKELSTCNVCPKGKYWTGNGLTEIEQEACAACPAGKYSPILRATSIAMCLMCPDYSDSPPGSSSVCDCSWEEFSRKPVPTIQKLEDSSDDSDTCHGESGSCQGYTSCLAGDRVKRGPDWSGSEEDGGSGKSGTVLGNEGVGNGWCMVKWDDGDAKRYRVGYDGEYDLCAVEGNGRSVNSVKVLVSGVAPVVLTLDGSEPDCKDSGSAKLSL
jgi:hypothetical protein